MNAQEYIENLGKEEVEKELKDLIEPIIDDKIIVTIEELQDEDMTIIFEFEDGSHWTSSLYYDDIDDDYDINNLLEDIAEQAWEDYVDFHDELNIHQKNFVKSLNNWEMN